MIYASHNPPRHVRYNVDHFHWPFGPCIAPNVACFHARLESRMSIGKLRSFLYALARLLGDVQAVRQGEVGKRIARRVAGRITGRALGKLFK